MVGLRLSIVYKYASLVQLVERWSPKPNVWGSNPQGRVLNIAIWRSKYIKCDRYCN